MRSSFARPRTSALRRAYLPAVACLAVSQALAAGPVQNPATPPEPPAADAPAAPPAAEAAAAPANADAVPKASDHSEFHGSVQLDNQYSPETDPLRATLALSYTNLFSKQDEMSALYQVAPQDAHQVGVFAAAYGAHPLPDGLQPQIYFIDSKIERLREGQPLFRRAELLY